MKELYFKAELLDDIVLSQRTATAGDHKSLDYIPGSAFLGAMAGKFYSAFGSDKAWDIFNSSKVCFCNAYPMMNNKRSTPMPLSFHSEKVPSKGKENEVLNFVLNKGDEKIQYRQNRSGYVDFNGNKLNVCSVEKTSRMRTAIDAKTGSAAKSQLYGYESINAGQIFAGKILWDDSVDSYEEFQKVIEIFKKGEILHIGRSRTASYGRVKVSLLNVSSVENKKTEGNTFSILAVSDLCLRNPKTGRAELQLLPEFLGLSSDWKLDSTRTFTRPNTVFPYNAFRRELETQKTLISKGSVFTLKSEKNLTSEEIASISEKLKTGIGTYRGQGFGEIALLDSKGVYEKSLYNPDEQKEEIKLTAAEEEWIDWLSSYSESEDVEKIVKPAMEKFKKLCKEIKTFNSFSNDKKFWPNKKQWENIIEVIKKIDTNGNYKKAIISKLFEGENPVIKKIKIEHTDLHNDTKIKNSDPEWNYKDSNGQTLRKWLLGFIRKTDDTNVTLALKDLCKRCVELVNKKDFFEEAD